MYLSLTQVSFLNRLATDKEGKLTEADLRLADTKSQNVRFL